MKVQVGMTGLKLWKAEMKVTLSYPPGHPLNRGKSCIQVSEVSPYILIFKPGYKSKYSIKPAREGHPDTIALTAEEKKRIKEINRLDPAELEKITTDKERLKNLDALGKTEFPGRHYSRKQLQQIFKSYEVEVNNLNNNLREKRQLLKNICDDKKFYIGRRGSEN